MSSNSLRRQNRKSASLMDKARLQEILAKEHKKLEEGGVAWLREYGAGAQKDLGFTFYMICRMLAQSSESEVKSTDLQKHLTRYMTDSKIQFKKKWNPVPFFLSKWTLQEDSGSETQGLVINSKTQFDSEYRNVLKKDGRLKAPMWLAEQYADDVRHFFGKEIVEPALRNEARKMNEESKLTRLGRELSWHHAEEMETVVKLLQERRQLIFYGPPGTGKTYVARELAKFLTKEKEERTFLQFHPSYSYEDFFEGYRPVPSENGGMPQFSLIPGPLKVLAEHAKRHPDKPHVLVIDEINRGNLAKIFGELYFLLEYREEEIMLQYGEQPFSLPENLLIIGTMNTADRSISHLDAALRRRFRFFPLYPDKPPIEGLLRRYLKEKHLKMERVADLVDFANDKLKGDGRDGLIGHSYFMPRPGIKLDESWIERVWNYSIMPLIEDRFIDDLRRISDFKYETIKKEADQQKEQKPDKEAGEEPA